MRIEELSSVSELEVLRGEWLELLSRSPAAPPFLTPEWLLAWWRHLGGGRPFVLAVREGRRLVALAPLFVYEAGARRRLALAGSGVSDELDLVAEPHCAGAAAAVVLEHLRRRSSEWDEGVLEELPAESPLLEAQAALERTATPGGRCHVLRLPATGSEFLAGLRPHQRRNLRRARRLLEARGPLLFERASQAGTAEALSAVFALHGARWRERGEPGVLADPALHAFHREAAAGLAVAGLLRLRTLRVGGRVAAALYGFARGRRAYAYLGGFDPALAQASPGTVLTEWAITDSIADGASSYDFLRGDEPHKATWGAEPLPRLRVELRA